MSFRTTILPMPLDYDSGSLDVISLEELREVFTINSVPESTIISFGAPAHCSQLVVMF